jgi:hypothetical protein
MEKSDSLRDALWNDGLAHYRWGTSTIWFSPIAFVQRRSPVDILAASVTNSAPWRSDAEFRQTVALLHEIVHYLQDVTTGVGHWDYVQRRLAVRKLLTLARTMSHTSLKNTFFNAEINRDKFLYYFQDSLFNMWSLRCVEEHNTLRTILIELGISETGTANELFSVESIFEAEAVLQVYSTVSQLRGTDEAVAFAENNETIFNPFRMAIKYSGLFVEIIQAIFHGLGISDLADLNKFFDENEDLFQPFYLLYIWLLDASLAYPPPTYFKRTGHDRRMFLPGVKFIKFSRGLHAIPLEELESAKVASQASSTAWYEDRIIKYCEFQYPKVQEVYREWIDYFSANAEYRDDPLALQRIGQCLRRIETSGSRLQKDLLYWVDSRLPLFFNTGRNSSIEIVTSPHSKFPGTSEFADFYGALLGDLKNQQLAEWLFSGKQFRCPIADICSVKIAECVSGLSKMAQMPEDEQCGVRNGLNKAGFRLTGW